MASQGESEGVRMSTPITSGSENPKPELAASIKTNISSEPKNGKVLDYLNDKERITIQATPPRKINSEALYRVLYPEDYVEIALIINLDLTHKLARAAIADLKQHTWTLHWDNKLEPSMGARIYLEYKDLINKHGWTTKDVMEQVTYDLNITWLMMKIEKPGSDLYTYAEQFQHGLIDYLGKQPSKISGFLDPLNEDPENEVVPFPMDFGFELNYATSLHHITDANISWKKIYDDYNLDENFTGVLICFWCLSYASGYWTKLRAFPKMGSYKQKHRDELVAAYINGLQHYLPKLYKARKITPKLLEDFLTFVRGNYTSFI